MNPSFSILINTSEILALSSLFRIPSWIGVDFLKAYSPKETEELVRQGIYSLNERGFLSKDQNNIYCIHAGFNKVMKSVIEPVQVFSIFCESQKAASWVFLHPHMHVIENRTEEGLEFVAIKDLDGIHEYLCSMWGLNRSEPDLLTPHEFNLNLPQVQDALAENPDSLEALFLKENIPQTAWSMLMQLLDGSIHADSITQHNPFFPEIVVDSFRWIASENCALQIIVEGDGKFPYKLRFESSTFAKLKSEISNLLKQ